jgi:hypothetical protein
VTKYGVNYYGATTYGQAALLNLSVQPMSVLVYSAVTTQATEFRKVKISWQPPVGSFTEFRLVRSQSGYPETAEDGIVIFQEYASSGTVSRSYFIDGEDNPTDIPLVSGRQAYYRVFLFTSDKIWVNAGSITAIVPSNHGVQSQLMSYLPKVYTAKEQSPLGSVDTSSALYNFIWGLSFTQEEFMTYLDLLRPYHTGLETPIELITAETTNVGLVQESGLPTKNQKRLVREAFYVYTHKGTGSGLQTYAESLTGFAPIITVSTNMLLTVQDSTFYGHLGNWVFTNATASVSQEQVPNTVTTAIDTTDTCKLVASSGFTMLLGEDDPIRKGVPVIVGTQYTVSCQVKSPSSAGNVVMRVDWFDGTGASISSSTTSSVSANNTWKTLSNTATAPTGAVYAGLCLTSNNAGTYYVDQVCMQQGSSVSYDEARAVDIFLSPIKTNLINNPSFETNVTDSWTLAGSATAATNTDVSDIAYSGSNSAKIIGTGSWSFTSNTTTIKKGIYYTASGLVKSNAPLTVTFVGRDSGNNIVETADLFTIDTTTTWSRFTISHLIDAFDDQVATYELHFAGTTGTYYLDCIQFEEGNRASDYFDGSLPSDFGAIWGGTANNSVTYLYPSKPAKVTRLGKSFVDWLPMNTFWRLRTYAGVEYTTTTV